MPILKCPVMLFTATVTAERQQKIAKLMLLNNPVKVEQNPNRHNIFYDKLERPRAELTQDHLDEILGDICSSLKENPTSYPLTIFYTNTYIISYCYSYMNSQLGSDQYVGTKEPESRIFAQYHQEYTEKLKTHVVQEICKENSRIRIVFATVALGLGLDAPHVRHVIHYIPPTSLEHYFQETGRSGRDGQPAKATLYYNNFDIRQNRPGMTTEMASYCRSTCDCLRKKMLAYFGWTVPIAQPKNTCCGFCKQLQAES